MNAQNQNLSRDVQAAGVAAFADALEQPGAGASSLS
jgi:hypothetical protein